MLAIIGGSGFYDWDEARWHKKIEANTEYGQPSSPIYFGKLVDSGTEFCFLARHGLDHEFLPHKINYRANVKALAENNIESIIAVNAVGSIETSIPPAGLIIPHQLIDYTWGRASSFDQTVNAHIDFTRPFNEPLRKTLLTQANKLSLPIHEQSVYACTQGPRLESAAEVDRMERDGADIIGMTLMPEAVLAREAGIRYAAICISVNPAAGRSSSEITMEEINLQLEKGLDSAKLLLQSVIG